MPVDYVLKKNPLSKNRINKYVKNIIDESNKDREMALEGHEYFKNKVEENPQDAVSKGLMVDCLKLAQNSKQAKLKVIDIVVKMNLKEEAEKAKTSKKEPKNLYEELDNLSNE